MFMTDFINSFLSYFFEMAPALALGLLISGIVHEFVPDNWVIKYLGKKGFKAIFLATLIGAIVPVCCWGSLPIAVSFKKKGASMGPVFSFLSATPATSINALLVSWQFMGFVFTLYIFFAVLIIGILMGIIGNQLQVKQTNYEDSSSSNSCSGHCKCEHSDKSFLQKTNSVFQYAFIEMPKEIGLETIAGLALAAFVVSFSPIGNWIQSHLNQGLGYLFSVIFGLVIYMCATMSVPLVHAFITKGLSLGAGMALLILGPIVSYGTVFVLRKEFGFKVLLIFILSISGLSLLSGYLFQTLV